MGRLGGWFIQELTAIESPPAHPAVLMAFGGFCVEGLFVDCVRGCWGFRKWFRGGCTPGGGTVGRGGVRYGVLPLITNPFVR